MTYPVQEVLKLLIRILHFRETVENSQLTPELKTVYRVLRVFLYTSSISCTKNYRVRYSVSAVKIKFLKVK